MYPQSGVVSAKHKQRKRGEITYSVPNRQPSVRLKIPISDHPHEGLTVQHSLPDVSRESGRQTLHLPRSRALRTSTAYNECKSIASD